MYFINRNCQNVKAVSEMNMRVTREVQYNHKIIHVIMSTHKSAVCRNITTNSTKCL